MTKPEDALQPDAVGSQVDLHVRPCPFCGGTRGTDEQGETYRWRLWRCSECGACGPETRCNITGSGRGGVVEARTLALDEWNKRVGNAELERLRLAVVVAQGALLECSPCAQPDCQAVQREWLTDAIAACERALAGPNVGIERLRSSPLE
ncbi:MAG: Restriction alleviation protein Lar [Pseudomonadota bacterium]|jgi:hypothetical protein